MLAKLSFVFIKALCGRLCQTRMRWAGYRTSDACARRLLVHIDLNCGLRLRLLEHEFGRAVGELDLEGGKLLVGLADYCAMDTLLQFLLLCLGYHFLFKKLLRSVHDARTHNLDVFL